MTGTRLVQALGLLVVFSFLWWVFTDGSLEQLWFGLAVAVGTTLVAMTEEMRLPGVRQAQAVVRFLPYFIYQSLKGGVLVAKLALLLQRRIRSEYFEYLSMIPKEETMARMWFASSVCIFPGTLSCGYRGNILIIHVLDVDLLDLKSMRELEGMVEEVFGIETRRGDGK